MFLFLIYLKKESNLKNGIQLRNHPHPFTSPGYVQRVLTFFKGVNRLGHSFKKFSHTKNETPEIEINIAKIKDYNVYETTNEIYIRLSYYQRQC